MNTFWMKITAALLILAGYAAWFYSIRYKSSASSIRTLTVLAAEIPTDLDTAKTVSYTTLFFTNNLYRRIFRVSPQLDLEGDLAESWTIDQHTKTIAIRLKSNQHFSDGSVVTAADVLFSLKLATKPSAIPSSLFRNIVAFSSNAPNILTIQYSGSSYSAVQQLSSSFLPIFKNETTPKMTERASWIVSDEYRIVSWTFDAFVVEDLRLKRTVVIQSAEVLSNVNVAVDAVMTRGSWLPQDAVAKAVGSANDWQVHSFDSLNSTMLFFADTIPLSHRTCIANGIQNNVNLDKTLGRARNRSYLPVGMLGRQEAEFSAAVPTGPEISTEVLVMDDDFMKQALPEIGNVAKRCRVIMKFKPMPMRQYMQNLFSRKYGAAVISITVVYNDPSLIFSFFHSGSRFNFGRIFSPDIDLNLTELSNTEDRNKVKAIIETLQKDVTALVPAVPLAMTDYMLYLRKGWSIHDLTNFDLLKWNEIHAD